MSKKNLWAVADCETDAFDGQAVAPFVWAIQSSEGDRLVFWETAEFIDWLREFDGKVYAHNGGKFDWLMPEIVPELEHGQIKIINGRLAKARIGKAEIRDSWLCLPAALAAFGEKDVFDYGILLRENARSRKQNRQVIEKYIRQDCAALFNAMERFISRHGFTLTQAGAALKTWEAMGGERRRYGIAHDTKFRPYYFGGRCEALEKGPAIEGPFVMFDINSSYPAAMSGDHPAGTDYKVIRKYANAHPSSFFHVYGISAGAFPARDQKSGRLLFPRDKSPRDYFITGHELFAALELGLIDIIEWSGMEPRRFETMRPYVQRFYEEKRIAEENGDKIGRQIAKIFMNSLYGKYASNPDEYRDYKIVPAGHREPGWALGMMLIEHDILERPTAHPEYYDVALGASITGQARANLMRAMFSSKRVIYCDTDSVVCQEFGGEVGDNLGQWKFEADIQRAWIAGKKSYAFEIEPEKYKTAHKGISKADITVEDIKRAAAGEVVVIGKSAPNIKLTGEQKFFARTLKIT